MKNEKSHSFRSHLMSLALHVLALSCLFIPLTHKQPEKLAIMQMNLTPPASTPEPPAPTPKPPDPEPPAPAPEPPAPEPPAPVPEPPAPEPPAPVPEPPAPQPKPQPTPQPKPQPTPQPTPQPKPQPKPQPTPQPKPQQKTQPKPQQKPRNSIADRLKNSQQVTTPSRTRKNSDTVRRLQQLATQQSRSSNTPVSRQGTPGAYNSPGILKESNDYAERIVRPYIYENWLQPSKNELDVSNASPVDIEFTVYSNGAIAGVRIVKASNSRIMNQSISAFLRTFTRLQPLSAVGSKASSLHVTVTIGLSY